MTTFAWRQYDVRALQRYDPHHLISLDLFHEEEFRGYLLCFGPGQEIPLHTHAHEHEVFDVVEGTGLILVGEAELRAAPGKSVFVPAGVPHGFRNDSDGRWLVRATVHERLYPRSVLKLLLRAVRKRLGLAPR